MALQRLNKMLKPGGQLYLSDIIFEQQNVNENIEKLIAWIEKAGGKDMRQDVENHIKHEFSTYDWILDGLLGRADFEITSKVMQDGVIGRYLCRKK